MKKLLTISLFSFLLFFGCNEETEVISPINTGLDKQLTLIPLPAPSSGLIIETEYTEYKDIHGSNGGEFSADYSYQGGTFGTVTQLSILDFDAGAFQGLKTISQTFNTNGAAVVFGPTMQFQEKVKYTYGIRGLDLTSIDPNTLDFVYIDANGNMYSVDYESITMDVNTGMLKVVDAELPHFSRYGFVN